jgi:hypothetical protein
LSSPILRDKNRCEIGAISAKIKAWAPTLSIAGMASPNVGDSQSIQSSGGDSYIMITEVRSPERRPVHTQRYHWVAVGGGSMHSHPLTGCVVLVAGARRGGRSVPAHTQRSGSAAAPDKARGCAPGIDAVCVISHACAWLAPARTTAHRMISSKPWHRRRCHDTHAHALAASARECGGISVTSDHAPINMRNGGAR